MCLAVPGKVLETNGKEPPFLQGTVLFGSSKKLINLSFVENVQVGEYVVVHAGVAISILNEKEAQKVFQELDQLRIEE
jgi:hydrogenase expression/formation protein HypC